MRRCGESGHLSERAVSARPGARGFQIALRREEDAGAHPVHTEDGQAAEELTNSCQWLVASCQSRMMLELNRCSPMQNRCFRRLSVLWMKRMLKVCSRL